MLILESFFSRQNQPVNGTPTPQGGISPPLMLAVRVYFTFVDNLLEIMSLAIQNCVQSQNRPSFYDISQTLFWHIFAWWEKKMSDKVHCNDQRRNNLSNMYCCDLVCLH